MKSSPFLDMRSRAACLRPLQRGDRPPHHFTRSIDQSQTSEPKRVPKGPRQELVSTLPKEVCLSPNTREKPPSDPRGVIRITRKLRAKNLVLCDGAVEQKRHAKEHKERSRKPRSERGSACRYDQKSSGVTRVADEGIRPPADDVLAAVGLDANN